MQEPTDTTFNFSFWEIERSTAIQVNINASGTFYIHDFFVNVTTASILKAKRQWGITRKPNLSPAWCVDFVWTSDEKIWNLSQIILENSVHVWNCYSLTSWRSVEHAVCTRRGVSPEFPPQHPPGIPEMIWWFRLAKEISSRWTKTEVENLRWASMFWAWSRLFGHRYHLDGIIGTENVSYLERVKTSASLGTFLARIVCYVASTMDLMASVPKKRYCLNSKSSPSR